MYSPCCATLSAGPSPRPGAPSGRSSNPGAWCCILASRRMACGRHHVRPLTRRLRPPTEAPRLNTRRGPHAKGRSLAAPAFCVAGGAYAGTPSICRSHGRVSDCVARFNERLCPVEIVAPSLPHDTVIPTCRPMVGKYAAIASRTICAVDRPHIALAVSRAEISAVGRRTDNTVVSRRPLAFTCCVTSVPSS